MRKQLLFFLPIAFIISYYMYQQLFVPPIITKFKTMDIANAAQTLPIFQQDSTIWEEEVVVPDAVLKPLPKDINRKPKGQYTALKQRIKILQQSYQINTDSLATTAILDSARQEITQLLLQEIFPHWYGTEWDFNGYTAIPQKGEIACGYFVSTTLRDVGFKLNRYHLAQQAGYFAALSLQKKSKLRIIRDMSVNALQTHLLEELKLAEGLYFIGLDNHVGYLLVHRNELYFIHSNYATDAVMMEHITDSLVFGSAVYVIADITHNDELIQKWIRGETVKIIRK